MFHIAFASSNFNAARHFYGKILQLPEGRSGLNWVDYNFYGNQLTIQEIQQSVEVKMNYRHPKSGMPLNHFGVILPWDEFHTLVNRLHEADVFPIVDEQTVMEGEVGEQKIIMFQDPDANVIEFKTFKDLKSVFATE